MYILIKSTGGIPLHHNILSMCKHLEAVAIDIPGRKRSLVKKIIAQTTILKRAIKKV